MNSFKLFEFKQKLKTFSSVEDFFESHSISMREEKGKNRAKKVDFFSKLKKFKRVHHV